MRLLALVLAPLYFLAVNEHLNDFMLRPASLPATARRLLWRLRNFTRWHLSSDGPALVPSSSPARALDEPIVYQGKPATGKPHIPIASAWVPFPLSHGGAVRTHNLTLRAAEHWDQILLGFIETGEPPALELLDRFVEVILVRRTGSHLPKDRGRPEMVARFDSSSFRDALRESIRRWNPAVAQLEFTHMAQYARECNAVPTILVEHDITFDLYRQMLYRELAHI